jgi:Kdo2-lipid IVA lauroyltransferase/acyltransferase
MKRLRYRLEYRLVRLTLWLARWCPWRLTRAMGAGVGRLFHTFDRRHRRIALANVVAAFPHRAPADQRAIVRGVFIHFGRLLFELMKFSGLTREQMLSRVEWEGARYADAAYAAGRGVLFFTGHFGYWEIQAIAHAAASNRSIGVLARALDNPALHGLLEQIRGCTGNFSIYRRGAIRRVLRTLQSNQSVAILIDQHIQPPDAVTVNFFDRPASTTLALAMLARRTGAAVIPVFAMSTAPGRYRMVFEHPVDPPQDDSPEAILDFTQRCTDVLEMYVRRHPELWLWMHRRWRDEDGIDATGPGVFPLTGPDGEGGQA